MELFAARRLVFQDDCIVQEFEAAETVMRNSQLMENVSVD
jgi:hypothetical protein